MSRKEETLPEGWISRVDPRYNRTYYFNKVTKESTWIKPRLANDQEQPQRRRQWSMTNSPLDEFVMNDGTWIRVYSNNHSKFYFYNKSTGKTTWNDPRLPRKASSRKVADSNHVERKPTPQGAVSSDEDEDGNQTHESVRLDDDPDVFQQKVMAQFPGLKKAFEELGEAQRKLQRDREEHEARVKTELQEVNEKLEELKKLQEELRQGSPQASAAVKPQVEVQPEQATVSSSTSIKRVPSQARRALPLDKELKRFSIDLERRSITVVEKRRSLVEGAVTKEDLKKVADEANRLAANRNDSERKMNNVEEALVVSNDELKDIASEMDTVSNSLAYAVKEAEAQTQASQEAREIGHRFEEDYGVEEFYSLLGVNMTATNSELKRAQHLKLKQWHPDKVGPELKEMAQKMTDDIRTAFKVLSDPWEREIYDWFGLEQYLIHSNVISCFKNYLISGLDLIKHPRKGYPRKRKVWLDPDCTEIKSFKSRVMEDMSSGKEKIKGVQISSITDVTVGRQTEVLKRTGRKGLEGRYFSLICEDRTLDFECMSDENCAFLAARMKLLIIDLKRDKQWMYRHYDEQSEDDS